LTLGAARAAPRSGFVIVLGRPCSECEAIALREAAAGTWAVDSWRRSIDARCFQL